MTCRFLALIVLTLGLATGCEASDPPTSSEPIFTTDLPKTLTSTARIASESEPGERLRITGLVTYSDGKTPASGLIMYFYHTNALGRYPKHGHEDRSSHAWWHGYLRGWLRTDADGRYTIESIKPAAYPQGGDPAHIHSTVMDEATGTSTNIPEFLFEGDEFITEDYWRRLERFGEPRVTPIKLERRDDGILEGSRNIVLTIDAPASSNAKEAEAPTK